MKTKVIQARISERLLERLDKALEYEGITRSDMLIQSISRYVDKVNKIKFEEEKRMSNFKHVGVWWNDKSIDLVEIEGEVYALNGWNGESYLKSWKCSGDDLMTASEEEYRITPIYEEVDEDDFEIVSYEVEAK